MANKIPPLLQPYLSLPPEASLILLTSVLGASTNWLVLRFLHGILRGDDVRGGDGVGDRNGDGDGREDREDTKVVLVSFLRDLGFWKEGGRRLGLDLSKLATKNQFTFIDGLSGLFLPQQKQQQQQRPSSTFTARRNEEKILRDSKLAAVEGDILNAVKNLGGDGSGSGKVVLVIDQLDLLLATTARDGGANGDGVSAVEVGELLMGLREEVHSVILTLSADYPLVAAAKQTLLEINHAAFLLGIAHQADLSMGLRLLDSGTARDVSGVVRITVGDQGVDNPGRGEERELLYFVGGDGGVRVFERGQ